jgi:hypothetical protein
MKPIKLEELTIIFGIDGILLTEEEPTIYGPRSRETSISPGSSKVLAKHYAHAFRVIADHFETIVEPWAEQADAINPTITLKEAVAALDRVRRNYGAGSEEYHQAITEGPTELSSGASEWDY